MSAEEVKAILYTCDGCGYQALVANSDHEPAYGYHGTVYRIGPAGGSGTVNWYACRESHIARAVLGAFQKSLDEGRA